MAARSAACWFALGVACRRRARRGGGVWSVVDSEDALLGRWSYRPVGDFAAEPNSDACSKATLPRTGRASPRRRVRPKRRLSGARADGLLPVFHHMAHQLQ